MASDSSRFCIIEADKGPVRIEVSVDKALLAGGEFRLIDESKQLIIEKVKVTVDDKETQRIVISKNPEKLHREYLVWQFLVCTMIPTIKSGKVYINIFQGNTESHITMPADMSFANILPCKFNSHEKLSGSLSFIVKKTENKFQ